MMIFPEITVSASKKAISIWMNAVVPSLLPFMMIAGCMKNTGVNRIAGSRLYPVCMAFLSGYPMGAKLAGDLYREGKTDEEGMYQILSYSMITGPAFLVSGVGVAFYGAKSAGYILAFSHYASAFTCGLLFWRKNGKQCKKKTMTVASSRSDMPFTDCILESFKTLGVILGYMMLFLICTDFMDFTGMLDAFSQETGSLCKGLLEMTVGCSQIATCSCSIQTKMMLSSFVISFGGLSVVGQTMSMLRDCPVTLIQILQIKILHGVLSVIWTFILCAFVV